MKNLDFFKFNSDHFVRFALSFGCHLVFNRDNFNKDICCFRVYSGFNILIYGSIRISESSIQVISINYCNSKYIRIFSDDLSLYDTKMFLTFTSVKSWFPYFISSLNNLLYKFF